MSIGVFAAVLGAALLHASWNALLKLGDEKFPAMVIMTLIQGGMGIIVAMMLPWPAADVWPWLIASGLFHMAYKFFLIFAYEKGDLSRVYPIARGSAPLIVLFLSPFLLGDIIGNFELFGILILGVGIITMARGAFTSDENIKLIPLALMSAAMTAGYSIVDGLGARIAGDATLFVAWLFALDALFLLPAAFALRGKNAMVAAPKVWLLGGLAAVASYGAYAVAVWAMTIAPIALVTALRETSILFAVLIGWLFFSEKLDRTKLLAASLIVFGVAVTRF